MVTHTDEQIGRLVEFLDRSGLRDDTLLMVMSDNGASAEGGTARAAERVQLLQRRTGVGGSDAPAPRRMGLAAHASPLRIRLGDGGQHPEPDVQGVRARRRHPRSVGRAMAESRSPMAVPYGTSSTTSATSPRPIMEAIGLEWPAPWRARAATRRGDEPALQPHRRRRRRPRRRRQYFEMFAHRADLGRRMEGRHDALVTSSADAPRPHRTRPARW